MPRKSSRMSMVEARRRFSSAGSLPSSKTLTYTTSLSSRNRFLVPSVRVKRFSSVRSTVRYKAKLPSRALAKILTKTTIPRKRPIWRRDCLFLLLLILIYHFLLSSEKRVNARKRMLTEKKYTTSRVSRMPRLMEL